MWRRGDSNPREENPFGMSYLAAHYIHSSKFAGLSRLS